MQPTTRVHHGIPNAILQETDCIVHHPIAFHPINGVFNADSHRGHTTIGRVLRRREFPATRCFLRLDDRAARQKKSLEARILIQATAGWPGIACQPGNALISGLSVTGVAQAAEVTGLVDHEEVVDRVALVLAAVVCLLFLGSGRARDRSLRALMPTRGAEGHSPSVWWRTSPLTHRRSERGAARAGPMLDSTRYAGDESPDWRLMGTSQRAVLGVLAWDAVSPTSA